MNSDLLSPVRPPRSRAGIESKEVLRSLQAICAQMKPGDVVPTYQEIMRQMDASERSVRWALDELSRQGVIIRRPRARTVIASNNKDLSNSTSNNGTSGNGQQIDGVSGQITFATNSNIEKSPLPILAIGEPDGGIFDHAMRVLMKHAKNANKVVHCQFMQTEEIKSFDIPALEAGVRSFIVFRQHFLPLAERLRVAGHNVVFVGTTYAGLNAGVPSVSGDQEQGGYLAVRHLLDLGHRRIAFHFPDNYERLRRWTGGQRALEEAKRNGLDVQQEILDWEVVSGWKQQPHEVKAYFNRIDAPTGIMSWNDDNAIELLMILLANGIRVPDDVSLMGYDNLKRSEETHPALTTVNTALDTQIQLALCLLGITPTSHSHHTVVAPTIMRRESTAPAQK